MKRRDFVRNTALTAIGTSLTSMSALAGVRQVTHLKSEDLTLLPKIKDDYTLHFMSIGDWGRNGEYDQLEVAKQMGLWGADHPNNFVISNGDNFYPKGVISEFDPLWHYSFENIYTAHSLQCDWYPVLGNHDYHTDVDAQLRYSKISRRWDMPARYYSKEFNLTKTKDKEDEPAKDGDKPKPERQRKSLADIYGYRSLPAMKQWPIMLKKQMLWLNDNFIKSIAGRYKMENSDRPSPVLDGRATDNQLRYFNHEKSPDENF